MDEKHNIISKSVADFVEAAYLEYSMYVILDRALPQLTDGMKPVQRRIIYAMSELGLATQAKYKKSARTVGDVIGKFHPHGDAAAYEAMVLMAQTFSYRYPLIDGQGNWGSQDDPKSFAAMRYTESKLTAYASLLLDELTAGTVDWQPNFDGSLQEPKCFPARLPNILLNGAMGIAVGMSTDIPSHNLNEVADACIALLRNPNMNVAELMSHIKAPDYPAGGEIIASQAILQEIYETGTGGFKLRAKWHQEGQNIIITQLPYQVSSTKVLEQIAQLIRQKKVTVVNDLIDESDHDHPVRIVLVLQSKRVPVIALLKFLFAKTDLERNCRVNLNVIRTSGKPQVLDLRSLLTEWIGFRKTTVCRRLQTRLGHVLDRLHILNALLTIYLNIDEVIRIIRFEDHPKQQLMQRFSIDDVQAEAILNLRLKYLAKLEYIKLQTEQEALLKEQKNIEDILNSPAKLRDLLIAEIEQDKEKFGMKDVPILLRINSKILMRLIWRH